MRTQTGMTSDPMTPEQPLAQRAGSHRTKKKKSHKVCQGLPRAALNGKPLPSVCPLSCSHLFHVYLPPSRSHNWQSKTFPHFQVQLSFSFLFEISQPSALPLLYHPNPENKMNEAIISQEASKQPQDKRQRWRSRPGCPAFPEKLRADSAGRLVLGSHALPT